MDGSSPFSFRRAGGLARLADSWHARPNRYFSGIEGVEFSYEDAQEPLVTVTQCFDDLLIAPDHVSRRPSDT